MNIAASQRAFERLGVTPLTPAIGAEISGVDLSQDQDEAVIAEIRAKITATGTACVFAEPQFPPAIMATVVEGTGAHTGLLDPLGADLSPGPDAYFTLLDGLARSLVACLG